MAANASRKTTAKKGRAKPKDTKAAIQAKKQMWAVVLFALGILLGAIIFIEGDKLWLFLHNLMFGFFGWSVYFLPALLIYISVIAAMDRPFVTIKSKLWQIIVLIIMISGAIQIFGQGMPSDESFAKNVVYLFEGGKEGVGGGIAGAIFALPLLGLFEKTGAAITIILLIFVFSMLVTGSTLIELFRYFTKPVKNIEQAYTQAVENRQIQQKSKPVPSAQSKRNSKFNIDVPIDEDAPSQEAIHEDMPVHPVTSEKQEKNSRDKLLSAISGESTVEHISAKEFLGEKADEIQEEASNVIPFSRPHPLEKDILKAENEEFSEIDDIIQRAAPQSSNNYGEEAIPPAIEIFPPVQKVTDISLTPPEKKDNVISGILGDIQEKTDENAEEIETIPAFEPLVEQKAPPIKEYRDNTVYKKPPSSLLSVNKDTNSKDVSEELKNNAQTLVDTLKSFGVQTRITDICRGPAVTRYELQPSAGVKISKITGLADDIALNLASAGIRIEAPIPNKPAVGIEVPNKNVSIVKIRDIIDSKEFRSSSSNLTVALGKDIAGNITTADIAKMPHVLIAGSTGSGKSVCINSIIMSVLYKSSPDEVKLLMVDPKVVELGIYNGIPHLLVPVVTDPRKAAGALNWAVSEMLNRYKTFAATSVRDLAGYNRLAKERDDLQPMPQIVIIIDELADLMMAAPNEVEDSICRLAQMARAAGMHLVIATQRPSVDVITGVIKANIPSRIAFAVSSQVDSRTILDMGGAEKLLGRGDMLFYPVGAAKPVRVQGCFVTDSEVEQVVEFVKQHDEHEYDSEISDQIDQMAAPEKSSGKGGSSSQDAVSENDEMLPQAIECVVEAGQASTSLLQRKLRLGYARAARIVDQLEEQGIVGPFEGSKPRQVLISRDRWIEMKMAGAENRQISAAQANEE